MRRRAYDTDLSDAEWHKIEPLVPKAKSGGRPRSQNLREMINAVFYIVKAGCTWRLLPHDRSEVADSVLLLPTLGSRWDLGENT